MFKIVSQNPSKNKFYKDWTLNFCKTFQKILVQLESFQNTSNARRRGGSITLNCEGSSAEDVDVFKNFFEKLEFILDSDRGFSMKKCDFGADVHSDIFSHT